MTFRMPAREDRFYSQKQLCRSFDELHLTICPFVFGGRSAPTIAEGAGAARLAVATRLRLRRRRRVGDELFCVFERVGK